jgi:hypothetical protein
MKPMPSDRAPDRLDALLGRIGRLEKAVVREMRRKEEEFFYRVRERKVEFTAEARARHRRLNQRLHHYLRESRGLVVLTGPVIWLCLPPLLLVDAIASLYQLVCFPIYGIPKVRRRDYLAFDRHHLDYLNAIEKLNCEYCAYANGILAYCTEIAARTEQYWCPIKHAQRVNCAHSRYRKFVDYGDGERYRRELEEVRRAFADVTPPEDGPASGG